MPNPDQSHDQRDLLKQLQHGECRALEALYLTYKDDLFTVAARLVGDHSAAEDILQELFVTLIKRVDALKSCDNVRAYLVASCRNRALDWLRRKRPHISLTNGVADFASTESLPVDTMTDKDDEDLIKTAMESLPMEQREVVVLHVYGRLTFREIGKVTEVSINTAESRYRYALAALKERLTRKGLRPC